MLGGLSGVSKSAPRGISPLEQIKILVNSVCVVCVVLNS